VYIYIYLYSADCVEGIFSPVSITSPAQTAAAASARRQKHSFVGNRRWQKISNHGTQAFDNTKQKTADKLHSLDPKAKETRERERADRSVSLPINTLHVGV
jgi:hypothetical protein